VPLGVTVSNLSGSELTFAGSQTMPWIDFIVTSSRGVPLTAIGKPAFGAVRIPSGKAMSRTVDLNKLFALRELGNYSVYAIVRLPGQERGGYQSRRYLFTVSNAKPYWSQVVGDPKRPGKSQQYRLVQFTGGKKNQLYVQIATHPGGAIVRTHHLGEVLMFRKPSVTIDTSLNMHVLYLITPSIWGHARVAPDGSFLGRDLYRSSAAGDPGLAKLEDGSVRAVGGIPYDPKAEAEEQRKTRKVSERPDFIYE